MASPLDRAALTPQMIEACRQNPTLAVTERDRLCELALDGLRFRIWCEGASPGGGVSRLAVLLASCTTPASYREALDKFIVLRAKGELRGL